MSREYLQLYISRPEVTYGVYVSPQVFLPPEEPPPLYPDAIGECLRVLLAPQPRLPFYLPFSPPSGPDPVEGTAFDRSGYERARGLASRSLSSSIGYSAVRGTK